MFACLKRLLPGSSTSHPRILGVTPRRGLSRFSLSSLAVWHRFCTASDAGPKQTAPWLQAFLVKGFEAEAQDRPEKAMTTCRSFYVENPRILTVHNTSTSPDFLFFPILDFLIFSYLWSSVASFQGGAKM